MMYGLLVPSGVDPALVDVLERFAESVDAAVDARIEEALHNITHDIERALEDHDPFKGLRGKDRLSSFLEDRIQGVREAVLNSLVRDAYLPEDSVAGGAVQEFLREEIGRGVVGGAMALEDRLMAIADNGVHKHRQTRPKQPKRYDTKILPGRW